MDSSHNDCALKSDQIYCVRPTGERWRCGQQASFALADRIKRATISCEPRDRDRYGRTVAVCFKEDEDLNRWMVANGWAVAYRRYSTDRTTSALPPKAVIILHCSN